MTPRVRVPLLCVWERAVPPGAVRFFDTASKLDHRVDGLSDAEARNVLQVMTGHQAQQAVKDGKRQWN